MEFGHAANDDEDQSFIALFVLEGKNGKKWPYLSAKKLVTSSGPFTNQSPVTVTSSRFEVSDQGYVIVPLAFKDTTERDWTLTIYADYDFDLVDLDA